MSPVARLKNEVATLRGLIALTPPGAGQRSLAARLSAVESELAETRDNRRAEPSPTDDEAGGIMWADGDFEQSDPERGWPPAEEAS